MNWRYAIYYSRIRQFIANQNDLEKIIDLLQAKLKKIKGKSVERISITTSVNNFLNGSSPTAEYTEAYLQVIDELIGDDGALDVLNDTYKNDKELELRQLLLKITKGRLLPAEMKKYINDKEILFELTEIFYIIIKLSFEKNQDPEQTLTRFRQFMEIFQNQNGKHS